MTNTAGLHTLSTATLGLFSFSGFGGSLWAGFSNDGCGVVGCGAAGGGCGKVSLVYMIYIYKYKICMIYTIYMIYV